MPSKNKKNRSEASSDSDRPTMDTANRHQEMKRGTPNVTGEGETSRSVGNQKNAQEDQVKTQEENSVNHEIHGPDGENFDSSVEHDSTGESHERGYGSRGIVET